MGTDGREEESAAKTSIKREAQGSVRKAEFVAQRQHWSSTCWTTTAFSTTRTQRDKCSSMAPVSFSLVFPRLHDF
ncbi:unnamed protein product [Haemonchus placei]|uniref:Uncharacterized protein n=1 Tax=Haemonchus placei TaxID=6290 RepID=A0A3P7VHG3_HAEPC|nr:unnamed protein product [Haemonchus placei]